MPIAFAHEQIWSGTSTNTKNSKTGSGKSSFFDKTKGVFTAPKSGTYQFFFTGTKGNIGSTVFALATFMGYLAVELRLNGSTFVAKADSTMSPSKITVTLLSTVKLMAGDRISLCKSFDNIIQDCKDCNHFSGWLLEEDLNVHF